MDIFLKVKRIKKILAVQLILKNKETLLLTGMYIQTR